MNTQHEVMGAAVGDVNECASCHSQAPLAVSCCSAINRCTMGCHASACIGILTATSTTVLYCLVLCRPRITTHSDKQPGEVYVTMIYTFTIFTYLGTWKGPNDGNANVCLLKTPVAFRLSNLPATHIYKSHLFGLCVTRQGSGLKVVSFSATQPKCTRHAGYRLAPRLLPATT
jgi:hypothetical protein